MLHLTNTSTKKIVAHVGCQMVVVLVTIYKTFLIVKHLHRNRLDTEFIDESLYTKCRELISEIGNPPIVYTTSREPNTYNNISNTVW